ncbi:MAG: hypothetical protein ABMB14_37345 [Myxococcota bacterium]
MDVVPVGVVPVGVVVPVAVVPVGVSVGVSVDDGSGGDEVAGSDGVTVEGFGSLPGVHASA